MRGRFITFEGTEGAGKSTLIRSLHEVLGHRLGGKRRLVLTREPGGTPLAERIRELILKNPMHPRTELWLYEAARAEHVCQVIEPALKRGDWVLCDRFTDSTLAYQGTARKIPWAEIDELNSLATRGRKPDLTVWLDIDPALGLRHAKNPNRFEKEGVAFQTRVRSGFVKARKLDPDRWLRLRARAGTPEALAQQVVTAMEERFGARVFGKSQASGKSRSRG